jgi:tocopherol cyclase
VNREETKAFAFIPGIAMDDDGKKHALIQVLDGKSKTSDYHRFGWSEFCAKPGSLDVSIDKSRFTESTIDLNLKGIEVQITMSKTYPGPKPFYSPGIRGHLPL